MTQRTRFWLNVCTVYAAGLLQGFAFVLIPALAGVLKSAPFNLSSGAYGALFLPETVGAIASALVAGRLEARSSANGVFRLGMLCNVAAAALLATSAAAPGSTVAYAMLLAETALLGFGFGLNLSVINHFAASLFPNKDLAAVTVLNAVIGGATALSPLILQAFDALRLWWLWPAMIGAAFLATIAASRVEDGRKSGKRPRAASAPLSHLLVLFAVAVLIYAIVEGTFGSWAAVYAANHEFAPRYGAWALAAFWGAMTAFRLLLGTAPRRWLPPHLLYLISPIAIAACFIAVALVSTAAGLVIAFACAGAACSIYYPFSMSFALEAFPDAQTKTAGVLVAALMAGEGIGSWLPGPLQQWFELRGIYTASALWGAPLLGLAWYLGVAGRKRRSQAAAGSA